MPNPPRVKKVDLYWAGLPAEPSPRCAWWVERIKGGWKPNRHVRAMGYHEGAEWFGVYIAEYLNVIVPLL